MEWLLLQAQKGKTPKALKERPELDLRQAYFFNAYQRLSGSRRASMAGAMPIPISEIESYRNLFKIHDVDWIEVLVDRIVFLDNVYLTHMAEKSAAASKKPKK